MMGRTRELQQPNQGAIFRAEITSSQKVIFSRMVIGTGKTGPMGYPDSDADSRP